MIGRRLLRLAVVGALRGVGLTVNGQPVNQESPGDWDIPEDQLPLLTVRTGDENKQAQTSGQPNFTTTCDVVVRAVVANTTAEAAQDDVELLWYSIEFAMLTNFSLLRATQRIASVHTKLDIKADGAKHLAGIVGVFSLEYVEEFDAMVAPPPLTTWPNDPPAPVPLTELTLTDDLVDVYDATGTYANPPFPAAVLPEPRASGPDGRAEGGLTFTLEGST